MKHKQLPFKAELVCLFLKSFEAVLVCLLLKYFVSIFSKNVIRLAAVKWQSYYHVSHPTKQHF